MAEAYDSVFIKISKAFVKFESFCKLAAAILIVHMSDLTQEISNTTCDLHVGVRVCDHVLFTVLL